MNINKMSYEIWNFSKLIFESFELKIFKSLIESINISYIQLCTILIKGITNEKTIDNIIKDNFSILKIENFYIKNMKDINILFNQCDILIISDEISSIEFIKGSNAIKICLSNLNLIILALLSEKKKRIKK